MNECVWLCVNGSRWPGHMLLMLPPQGTSGEMDVCAGSCCVVKWRLVKDGQHGHDQSSVDQDVLLPPRRSFSLNFTLNLLSVTTLPPSPLSVSLFRLKSFPLH